MARLSAVAAFGFDDLPTLQLLAAFRGLGVRSLQFYRNELKPPTVREAKAIAAEVGMTFDSIHGVFGPKYDPSSPDEAVRRAAMATYRREAELARDLGGPRVVVHPSPAGTAGPNQTRQRAALLRSGHELAEIGRELGATFLLENLPPGYAAARPEDVAAVVRDVNQPTLRMCFDTGHAHMCGDVVELLQACRDVVAYLHVHDNDGQRDSHEIPGDGTILWEDLAEVMGQLPADVPAMLELFQSPEVLRGRAETGLTGQLQQWLRLSA